MTIVSLSAARTAGYKHTPPVRSAWRAADADDEDHADGGEGNDDVDLESQPAENDEGAASVPSLTRSSTSIPVIAKPPLAMGKC